VGDRRRCGRAVAVALAVALLKAWRAGKALAGAVGTASETLAPLSALEVGGAGAAPAPLTEAELREREAALLAREAELERRLRTAGS
jgi:hypothetical protein